MGAKLNSIGIFNRRQISCIYKPSRKVTASREARWKRSEFDPWKRIGRISQPEFLINRLTRGFQGSSSAGSSDRFDQETPPAGNIATTPPDFNVWIEAPFISVLIFLLGVQAEIQLVKCWDLKRALA